MKNLPQISTEAIELDVQAGVPVRIVTALALGRAPVGWLVIWSDAPVQFHALPAPRGELLLMPSTDARVRIVVL